jgi:hypothetical protein
MSRSVRLVPADHWDGNLGANTGRTGMITTAVVSGESCRRGTRQFPVLDRRRFSRRGVVANIPVVKQNDKQTADRDERAHHFGQPLGRSSDARSWGSSRHTSRTAAY